MTLVCLCQAVLLSWSLWKGCNKQERIFLRMKLTSVFCICLRPSAELHRCPGGEAPLGGAPLRIGLRGGGWLGGGQAGQRRKRWMIIKPESLRQVLLTQNERFRGIDEVLNTAAVESPRCIRQPVRDTNVSQWDILITAIKQPVHKHNWYWWTTRESAANGLLHCLPSISHRRAVNKVWLLLIGGFDCDDWFWWWRKVGKVSLGPVLLITCLQVKEGLHLRYECLTLILTWQKNWFVMSQSSH